MAQTVTQTEITELMGDLDRVYRRLAKTRNRLADDMTALAEVKRRCIGLLVEENRRTHAAQTDA